MSKGTDLAGELQAFVAYLVENGIDAAIDVKDLQPDPGCVWVSAQGFTLDRLGGYTIDATALCIVGDRDPITALAALGSLVNQVTDLVDPVDTIVGRTVTVAPWGAVTLPALVVPIQLECDYITPDD